MGIPLFKLFSLMIRITSRPVSRLLNLLLRKQQISFNLFAYIGLKAHEFEAYLDYKAANPDVKVTRDMLTIQPIKEKEQFHKGIDYFVEFFMFYGILGALSIYELRKSIESGHQHQKYIESIESNAIQAKTEANNLKSELK